MSCSGCNDESDFLRLPNSEGGLPNSAATSSSSAVAVDDYGLVPWQVDSLSAGAGAGAEDPPPLNEGWLRKAQFELHEKQEWRERDIQALRDIVEQDTALKTPVDDAFLLRFLRAQKFDYEKAFGMMQRYYLMRQSYPAYFVHALPSLTSGLLGQDVLSVLPERDGQGRRVMLHRAGRWDPLANPPGQLFAATYLCLELLAREPRTQVAGLVTVMDMAGFGWTQIVHLSTDYVRSIANMIQNTFPLRFREIHIINESYLFDIAFALIKPFLSETIRSRIVCHGSNLMKLHETLAPSVLPAEFGGERGPMSGKDLQQALNAKELLFKELAQFGYDGRLTQADADGVLNQGGHPFQGYCMASTLDQP